MRQSTAAVLAAFLLLVAACSGASNPVTEEAVSSSGQRTPPTTAALSPTPAASPTPRVSPTPTASPEPESTATVPDEQGTVEAPTESALAAEIESLPAATVGLPDLVEAPRPIGLRIPSIGVADAPVIAAGVDAAGDFDVPPAEEVGWYEFGPRPGENGSAVLAAHIAFDGVDGVFRYLNEAEPGAIVSVDFADGTTREFEIADVESYDKEQLPTDSLFDRTGPARLALITCGGAFNYAESSYEDNVVAIAFERLPTDA